MKVLYYKKQGDGRDSWCIESEDGNIQMVYEDPAKPVIPNVDVVALLQSMKPEQLQAIKEILK
jgi:hypothetical protein